jgi:predicted PurR-regulated permease PerM
MSQFSQLIKIVFSPRSFKKLFIYGILILLIYFLRDFLGMFLLTFIFGYLFLTLAVFLKEKMDMAIDYVGKYSTKVQMLKKVSKINIFLVGIYLTFIAVIIFSIGNILPKISKELTELAQSIPFLRSYFESIVEYLQMFKEGYSEIGVSVATFLENEDYQIFLGVFDKIKNISFFVLQGLGAFILSFIFVIDRHNIFSYL